MKTWPNWVDLFIVTLVLRGCYVGFGRGLLAELLNLIGVVIITALSVNYAGVVASWVQPWLPWASSAVANWLIFWALLLLVYVVVSRLLKVVAGLIKWERLHWFFEGIGLLLGGLRGLWWSGVLLIALTASGFTYLRESVEERSIVGPALLNPSVEVLGEVTKRFPGAQYRAKTLIPPMKSNAKKA